MSPKYRLRPATGLLTSYERREHNFFIPLMMFLVVGGTTLLISTTQPLTPVTKSKTESVPYPPSEFEKVELRDFAKDLSNLRTVSETKQLIPEFSPPALEADKFVSKQILETAEPLPEIAAAIIPVADQIPEPSVPVTIEPPLDLIQIQNHQLELIPPVQPSKPQQLGKILLSSFEPKQQIPRARVVSGNSNSHCAVPILCSSAPKGSFTPWMTPEELNQFILSKNCGKGKSYWQQGNWITAIEGRTSGGILQFRIVCEPSPKGKPYRWHYRIAQSREDFNEKLEVGRKSGFKLVQSQMFVDSTNEPRFQAVWHRH